MEHIDRRMGQRHTDRCSGGLDDNKRIPLPGGLEEGKRDERKNEKEISKT